jgi:hypothetical protein
VFAWTHSRVYVDATSIRADEARLYADGPYVCVDAIIFLLGNFKMDAIVHLSHRRPSSHCLQPRLSVLVHPLDNRDGYTLTRPNSACPEVMAKWLNSEYFSFGSPLILKNIPLYSINPVHALFVGQKSYA